MLTLGLLSGRASAASNVFDISQPPYSAAPGPENAAATTAALNQALRDIAAANPDPKASGSIKIPAGDWYINAPIFMSKVGEGLIGAGVGVTKLHAADGFKDMSMIVVGARTNWAGAPTQTCNRVTSAMDGTVGTRYGVRSYTEYPATNFPATNHSSIVGQKNRGGWKADAQYAVNDTVVCNDIEGRELTFVCTKENSNIEPGKADSWKTHWVAKLPFVVHLNSDPMAAGAKNNANGRASDWADMTAFTLDFCFALNVSNPTETYNNAVPLCGVVGVSNSNSNIWQIAYNGKEGTIYLHYTLSDGVPRSRPLAKTCTASGIYRLSLQINFAEEKGTRVQAWVKRPADTAFSRTFDENSAANPNDFPASCSFRRADNPVFKIAGTGTHFDTNPGTTGVASPTDITVFGCHESNDLRYADSDTLSKRGGTKVPDDNFMYFTNDAGTFAYLPLTENPDEAHVADTGINVSVQHGAAAGDAKQQGYAMLAFSRTPGGMPNMRISDMTIVPGPTWGTGVLIADTLHSRFYNLDIHGGYYAMADAGIDAQYTTAIDNCALSGSEAGFAGWFDYTVFNHVTINPCGRFGVFVQGCNLSLYDVTFTDPTTYKTDSYVRNVNDTHDGQLDFDGITAIAAAGAGFPSIAAFDIADDWIYRVGLKIHNAKVSNMGKGATFINLPVSPTKSFAHCMASIQGSSYSGDPIDCFVRSNNPWWFGTVYDCQRNTPVSKWFAYTHPQENYAAWRTSSVYQANNAVVSNSSKMYVCTRTHTAAEGLEPGTTGGAPYWELVPANRLLLLQSTPEAPDATKSWIVDRHIITRADQSSSSSSEYRCAASPNTFAAVKPAKGAAPAVAAALPDFSKVAAGALVTFSATISDPDSTSTYSDVDHVDFFLDKSAVPFARADINDLPTTTAAPAKVYAQWRSDGQAHAITVIAYDKYGQTATCKAESAAAH
jgi:hypothetical protein